MTPFEVGQQRAMFIINQKLEGTGLKIRRGCAWCGCDLGKFKPASKETDSLDDGICPPCSSKLMKDAGVCRRRVDRSY